MPLYRDEAVVLRVHKLGEADRIVTLLTRRHGRVRAVGKGVRRTSSRFGARLEPGSHIDVQLYSRLPEGQAAPGGRRGLDVVQQTESLGAFGAQLADDYGRWTSASAICETAERLTEEGEPALRLYLLVVGALRALTRASTTPASSSTRSSSARWPTPAGSPRCASAPVARRPGRTPAFNVAGRRRGLRRLPPARFGPPAARDGRADDRAARRRLGRRRRHERRAPPRGQRPDRRPPAVAPRARAALAAARRPQLGPAPDPRSACPTAGHGAPGRVGAAMLRASGAQEASMGLIGKFSELRMKDPVEGELVVAGVTMPDPSATSQNYRIEGVVSGPGITPQAVVHRGVVSTGKWPNIGDHLPVTVDRAKPERIVVHWDRLSTGRDQAQSRAERLAAQMRGEVAPDAAAAGSDTGPGVQVTYGTGSATMDPAALQSLLSMALGQVDGSVTVDGPVTVDGSPAARRRTGCGAVGCGAVGAGGGGRRQFGRHPGPRHGRARGRGRGVPRQPPVAQTRHDAGRPAAVSDGGGAAGIRSTQRIRGARRQAAPDPGRRDRAHPRRPRDDGAGGRGLGRRHLRPGPALLGIRCSASAARHPARGPGDDSISMATSGRHAASLPL